MHKLDMRSVVFNAAAGVIGIAALLFAIRSMLPASAPPCGDHYPTAMSFALEREGALLSAADLQGRLAGRDLGLVQHVAIMRVQDAPTPVAMVVTLPKGAAAASGTTRPDGGVSFPWEPRALHNATSACLSYHVLLPASFEFAGGGALPGILLANRTERGDGGFLARLAWRSSSEGGADQVAGSGGEERALALEAQGFGLQRGQWMKVDQEVVLNAPGRRDGALRFWIDGALVLERTDMEYRSSPDITISGVAASLFYGSEGTMVRAPRETTVMFSPFEIRWQP